VIKTDLQSPPKRVVQSIPGEREGGPVVPIEQMWPGAKVNSDGTLTINGQTYTVRVDGPGPKTMHHTPDVIHSTVVGKGGGGVGPTTPSDIYAGDPPGASGGGGASSSSTPSYKPPYKPPTMEEIAQKVFEAASNEAGFYECEAMVIVYDKTQKYQYLCADSLLVTTAIGLLYRCIHRIEQKLQEKLTDKNNPVITLKDIK
jgi:hypothetical protein